jgi:hypothetical protein
VLALVSQSSQPVSQSEPVLVVSQLVVLTSVESGADLLGVKACEEPERVYKVLTAGFLIGFNNDRAAVQLGVSLSWGAAAQDREKWRKLAARLPLAPVPVETKPISEQARTERTQSEHAQTAPDPAATTNPLGRNDCGPGGRRGTIPYHTITTILILQIQT